MQVRVFKTSDGTFTAVVRGGLRQGGKVQVLSSLGKEEVCRELRTAIASVASTTWVQVEQGTPEIV